MRPTSHSSKTACVAFVQARHQTKAACLSHAAGIGQARFRLPFLLAANSATFVLP